MTFFLLYYLTCALAVTKQLSHRNRASQHVSSPGDAGIQRWGHDEAAMQAGKPSKAGKLCNVGALWGRGFASSTHVWGGPRVRVSIPTRCGRASFPGDSHERHAVRQLILLDRRLRGGENQSFAFAPISTRPWSSDCSKKIPSPDPQGHRRQW